MNSSKKVSLKQWLNNAIEKMKAEGLGSAQIDAELILSHCLKKERAYLLSHGDDFLDDNVRHTADTLLQRRLKFEPMAYILGHKEFFGLDFKTDHRALIPRGETETLVETAKTWLETHTEPQVVADIGTGSGAIILSLAYSSPHHHYLATDMSQAALDLAAENSQRLGIKGVVFQQGNLGEPLLWAGYERKINLLVSNLPYIPSPLLATLDPTITYFEPNLALDGGKGGLHLYEQLMPQAKQLLASGGLMLLEHDYDQGGAMRQLVRHYFPRAHIKIKKDYLGVERILYCQRDKTVV